MVSAPGCLTPLGKENNIKELKRERKKSLSGNQANRKWISGEQGTGREIKYQNEKRKNTMEKSKMDSCLRNQVGASFAGMTEEIIED
jgi:hypothetical protein